MKDDAKRTLTPKLRFPQFQNAEGWQTERMGKLYSFMGNNALSRDKLNYESGSVKNIHYGDIHTKFPALFDITKESVPYINGTEELPPDDSEDYCVEGDLIFADASEDTNDVGKSIEIIHLNGERLVSGQHTILARRNDDRIIVGFGAHLFRSARIRSQIQKEAQGTKVYAISATRLGNVELAFPRSEDEQQKIADCLASLEELIAAQGRKVEGLAAHKKGLMQQLFPGKGETLPRLRFPEFRGKPEWVATTLESVGQMKAGQFVSAYEIAGTRNNESFPCYGGNGLRGYTKTFTHDGKYALIGRQGALCGNAFLVDGKFHATEHALVVTPNDGIDVTWLYYMLGFLNLNQYSIGQAQPGLSVTVLGKVSVAIPENVHEQLRIADCLSPLDAQIIAESQKLDALKTHRRGLLQQLFPSPEAD